MRSVAGGVAAATAVLVVLVLGRGTDASWSASATVPGTTLHTGTLALQVGGRLPDADDLVPGQHVSAEVTVTNAGSTRLRYDLRATGDDALADALVLRTRQPGCGVDLAGDRALAPGDSERVCVELALPDDAPAAVAGGTTSVTLAAEGSAGGWTDRAATPDTQLSAAALTAPVLTCGTALLGQVGVRWEPVPGATAYRLHYGASGLLTDTVSGGVLSRVFSGVVGVVRVEAVLGSGAWVSPPSDPLAYSALDGLLATCS